MTLELIEKLKQAGLENKGTDLGGLLQWAVLHLENIEAALEKDCNFQRGAPFGKKPSKLKMKRDQRLEMLAVRYRNLSESLK